MEGLLLKLDNSHLIGVTMNILTLQKLFIILGCCCICDGKREMMKPDITKLHISSQIRLRYSGKIQYKTMDKRLCGILCEDVGVNFYVRPRSSMRGHDHP